MVSKCSRGDFIWILAKNSSQKGHAQGSGGVTVLGGVQEPCGCGTDGHGQWTRCDGLMVGLGDFRGLSQPSMVVHPDRSQAGILL